MRVYHGSYTGNGSDNRNITGVGFNPTIVWIKSLDGTSWCHDWVAVPGMTADRALSMQDGTVFQSNRIQSFISDGFQIGNTGVNENGKTYFYIAIRDTGTPKYAAPIVFTGDDNDGKAITGLGFQPDWLCLKSDYAIRGLCSFSSYTGSNKAFFYDGTANRADLIASLDADGVTVNNGSTNSENCINRGPGAAGGAKQTAGFALKAVAGKIAVFSYTGNGSDNRNVVIPGTSFQPAFVMVKREGSGNMAVHRFKQHSGDKSLGFYDAVNAANCIQQFNADGFQVGNDFNVNGNTVVYHVLAIADNFTIEDATATAGVTALTLTEPAPVVSGTGTATAAVTGLTLSEPDATATGGAKAAAAVTELTVSAPAPVVSGMGNVSAAVTGLTLSEPDATARGDSSIVAAVTELVLGVENAIARGDGNVAALVTELTLGMPDVTAYESFPPTIVADTPDEAVIIGETLTIEFTGSDADGDDLTYGVLIEEIPSVDTSYGEENMSAATGFTPYDAYAQTFEGTGRKLAEAMFYIYKSSGAATGAVYAKLYAHTGAFGTTGKPTGAALATAEIDASTLETGYQWITFSFDGEFDLVDGTHYCISLEPTAGNISEISLAWDTSAPTHAGNFASRLGATWIANSGIDAIFQIKTITLAESLVMFSEMDAGFANTVTPADTDPFEEGEKISFTIEVPAGVYTWLAAVWEPGKQEFHAETEVRTLTFIIPINGNASADETGLTLSAPAAIAKGDGNTVAAVTELTLTEPAATATGNGNAGAAVTGLALSAPDVVAWGHANVAALVMELLLGMPDVTATGEYSPLNSVQKYQSGHAGTRFVSKKGGGTFQSENRNTTFSA